MGLYSYAFTFFIHTHICMYIYILKWMCKKKEMHGNVQCPIMLTSTDFHYMGKKYSGSQCEWKLFGYQNVPKRNKEKKFIQVRNDTRVCAWPNFFRVDSNGPLKLHCVACKIISLSNNHSDFLGSISALGELCVCGFGCTWILYAQSFVMCFGFNSGIPETSWNQPRFKILCHIKVMYIYKQWNVGLAYSVDCAIKEIIQKNALYLNSLYKCMHIY